MKIEKLAANPKIKGKFFTKLCEFYLKTSTAGRDLPEKKETLISASLKIILIQIELCFIRFGEQSFSGKL